MSIIRPLEQVSPKARQAFSLIELTLAMGIFLVFAASLISVILVSSKNTTISKHRLQAANLAREGAEIIGQIRDTAWANGIDWNDLKDQCWGLAQQPGNDEGEKFKKLLYENPGGDCAFYHWFSQKGNNLSTGWPPGHQFGEEIDYGSVKYLRSITIKDLRSENGKIEDSCGNDCNIKKVTVDVTWSDYNQYKTVTVVTMLTDWKQ